MLLTQLTFFCLFRYVSNCFLWAFTRDRFCCTAFKYWHPLEAPFRCWTCQGTLADISHSYSYSHYQLASAQMELGTFISVRKSAKFIKQQMSSTPLLGNRLLFVIYVPTSQFSILQFHFVLHIWAAKFHFLSVALLNILMINLCVIVHNFR